MATHLPKSNRFQSRKRMEDGTRLAGYGKTEQEADADLAVKIAEHLDLIRSTPQPATLHEVAKAHWYPKITVLRHTSVKKYEGVYCKWIRPALGDVPIANLSVGQVQALIRRITDAHSSSLASFARGVVVQIVECAYREGLVPRNIARFAKAPKRFQKRERVLEPDEALSLLDHFDGHDLSAPVFLALILGLRRGEIAGLKWSDLNRRTGELHIVRQLQPKKGEGVIEEALKTDTSRRMLRLPRRIIDEIDKRGNLDHEHICTHRGERWVPNTLGRVWSENVPKDLEGWTFHDLRHGAAGLLYAQGCDLFEIAAVLGHKHPGMAALYTSVTSRRVADAIATLGEMLTRPNINTN